MRKTGYSSREVVMVYNAQVRFMGARPENVQYVKYHGFLPANLCNMGLRGSD
jgi:hypothetical protein